jgi:putative ABC transport system permease protein
MPDFEAIVRERLRSLGLCPAREAEIVDEIAQDLRDRYEAQLLSGASEDEAATLVLSHFDQRDLASELRTVEQLFQEPVALGEPAPGSWWSGLRRDIHYALRVLRLNPGFTTVCVLSLALGIGANTAIFQLLDAVRMRTLPVRNPEELFVIRPLDHSRTGHMTGRYSYVTNPMWEQVRAQQRGFDAFAWGTTTFNLASSGQVRYADGIWVSGELFDVVGVQPEIGRLFHAGDDHAGCGALGAVISHDFWQREFGGDPHLDGRTVSLEGHPFPVIGVTPAQFYGLEVGRRFDVAIPICSEPVIAGEYTHLKTKHAWWLSIIGRLKPGWTLEKAKAQLTAISPSVMQETVPEAYDADLAQRYLKMKLGTEPAAMGLSNLRRDYETPLWLLLAIAGLILLIACANLANLMLARASTREREIAIRLALGAARSRLIRQLLTESLMLAVTGAAFGIGLAGVLSRLLIQYLSHGQDARVFVVMVTDWRVLGFTTVLAFLTCVLFGLAPALKATSAPPARIMSLTSRGLTAARERFSLRRALVVMQVSLSLVLVVTALLFGNSLRKILSLDAGFQRSGMLIMDVDFTRLSLPRPQRMPFVDSLVERVRALPGIESAAAASSVPVSGRLWNDKVVVDGKVSDTYVDMNHVSPGYFATMRTPLLAGRDFDQRDKSGAPNVAIVNTEFARKILGTQNPIGQTYKIDVYQGEQQVEYQIIGLVRNTKYMELTEDFQPIAYYPQLQDAKPDPEIEVMVRSSLALEPLLDSLRHATHEFNSNIIIDFHVFDTQIKQTLLRERLLATLSGFFGALAMILATIGLYGVISYLVVRRTNEIGIRMALGATPLRILAMVVREATILLAVGLAIGIVLSVAAGKFAATLVTGLKARDPLALAAASLLLGAVALCASLLPARRAALLPPTTALREE